MAREYFTVVEVNARIPGLKGLFVGVMQVRAQLKTTYDRLQTAGYAPTRDDADELPEGAPEAVLRDRAQFYGLIETLREQVEAVRAQGCVIRDIETGLVDWLAREGGRDIELCWRFGERELGYWHELDAGFANRRPISELSPTSTGAPPPERATRPGDAGVDSLD
jgi:hypothetical protein